MAVTVNTSIGVNHVARASDVISLNTARGRVINDNKRERSKRRTGLVSIVMSVIGLDKKILTCFEIPNIKRKDSRDSSRRSVLDKFQLKRLENHQKDDEHYPDQFRQMNTS